MTTLLAAILVIAVVGILVWFLSTLPMPVVFRNAIIAIACVGVIIYLFRVFAGVRLLP